MKKLLIASLLSLGLVAGSVQAQETEQRYGKPDGSRMAQHLELTEGQLPAFKAIIAAQSEKRRALHQEFREQNQALEAETERELASVLTPEQLEKMQGMKEKRKEKWQNREGKHGELKHNRDREPKTVE